MWPFKKKPTQEQQELKKFNDFAFAEYLRIHNAMLTAESSEEFFRYKDEQDQLPNSVYNRISLNESSRHLSRESNKIHNLLLKEFYESKNSD